ARQRLEVDLDAEDDPLRAQLLRERRIDADRGEDAVSDHDRRSLERRVEVEELVGALLLPESRAERLAELALEVLRPREPRSASGEAPRAGRTERRARRPRGRRRRSPSPRAPLPAGRRRGRGASSRPPGRPRPSGGDWPRS